MQDKISIKKEHEKVTYRTMKYAILYAALFYKFSNQETLRVLGERVLQTIKKLSNILGNPSFVYLSEELGPLSTRYDYVFRLKHTIRQELF